MLFFKNSVQFVSLSRKLLQRTKNIDIEGATTEIVDSDDFSIGLIMSESEDKDSGLVDDRILLTSRLAILPAFLFFCLCELFKY